MTLVLNIINTDAADTRTNPLQFRMVRYGAYIGRSASSDWVLFDETCEVSGSHCEIDYRDGQYSVIDRSTNGTFVNGSGEPIGRDGRHPLSHGDVLQIGRYQLRAEIDGAAPLAPPPKPPSHGGWPDPQDRGGGASPRHDRPSDREYSPIHGGGGLGFPLDLPDVGPGPSDYSSEADTSAASGQDYWGKLEADNKVDWQRMPPPLSREDTTEPPHKRDPLSLGGDPPRSPGLAGQPIPLPPPLTPPPAGAGGWGPRTHIELSTTPPPPPPRERPTERPAEPARAAAPADGAEAWQAFLKGAQIAPGDIDTPPAEAMAAAGDALRRLVSGLVLMLEARARAKSQMRAETTSFSFQANNPLKWEADPIKALVQLLKPPKDRFMSADLAIDDAFKDLQAHQMATLGAMQGALAAALERFSPSSIRVRAESRGLLAKIIPSAREAELWRTYEKEFEGVARGSDEAFMDVFAKEFAAAYDRAAAEMRRRR